MARLAATAQAISVPQDRQALRAAAEYHVHLHGPSDEQLAAIITHQGIAPRPVIEEDPRSPSSS